MSTGFTKIIKNLHFYSFGQLKKIYDFVLSWAHKKYASYSLFALAFAESSFFPIPPDILQIALSAAKPRKSFFYALISALGSVLGGIFGYLIGLFLFESVGKIIIDTFGYQQYFETVANLYRTYAFWAVFAAAFTPIPYKVFTIGAGVFGINMPMFLLASAVGRSLRFFIVAALIYFFGARIKDFIEKYFNILTFVFLILILGGFLALKLIS